MQSIHQIVAVATMLGATAGSLPEAHAGSIKVDGSNVGPGVPNAPERVDSPESILAPGFTMGLIAQGIEFLENPSGVIAHFGFLSDASQTKTEPDINTYLVLDHNPGGPTPNYDYGRHFLF